MKINKITILNIKGIDSKAFNLELAPNKPNILVAPNGFGKSSFAVAFDSLKSNKIELEEKNYHLKSTANRPSIKLELSTGEVLVANDNQNTISDVFDVFVINNQTAPKSILQSFNGRSFAKTTLDILPTVLVQTIPPKISFEYSLPKMKLKFGTNGKILMNISNLFTVSQLFQRMDNEVDFTRFNLKLYQTALSDAIEQINKQSGTSRQIKNWILSNMSIKLAALDEFRKICDIIRSFGFSEIEDDADLFLCVWQILANRTEIGTNFKKACKYLHYLEDKRHYTETIKSFNPVIGRFDIRPKEERNSLIIHWPKAHEISNGQRDILTFIAMLFKSRRDFKKRDCILVIDEIFDYMDDGNLITFQYYISTFIDQMKQQKRRIFPLLLTHLDPLFFNHFCFNDSKIKVNYLKELNVKSNQQILKLIYNREETAIQSDLDTYFFHYHPNRGHIDLTTSFTTLKLNLDWAKPEIFFKRILREVRRYLFEDGAFDPLAVCFGVRTRIEELVYDKIPDAENKRLFIDEIRGTKNKLRFAQSIGVNIPETYYLLGIIYNTSLHLQDGQDASKPLGLKLENGTIRQMIQSLWPR